jgi:iron-sulfur cluster repair protein YtfE (RIC family)
MSWSHRLPAANGAWQAPVSFLKKGRKIMNRRDVQSFFGHDHEQLDGFLESYRRTKRIDFAKAKRAFQEFKFGLQRHIIWEETVLFPLFEDKTGMREFGPTAVMRGEHREIGRRLEALHAKVLQHDVDSDQEELRLLEVLFAHNQKEENVLYPAIDRLSTDQEKADMFHRMSELPEKAYQTCCVNG